TMKSHSSKGGGGFNELRFEDKKGEEQVFIHSRKRMDVRVLGSLYETNHANRHMVVGHSQGTESGGNFEVTVSGDNDIHVKGGRFEAVDAKLNLAVGAEVVYDFQANKATLVSGKAELNAREVIIEASQKIGLKVGGNFITIDPSGITMNGTLVKINSGGYGTETGDASIDDPLDASASDTGEPGYLERLRRSGGGGRRGRNSRRLRSQHARFPAPAGEDPRMTAMRDTLQDSAAGRHALDVMQRNGAGTRFDNSDGYYFDPSTNTMTMNPDMDPAFQTTGVVHEMTHAEAHHDGTTPNIQTSTREEYVNGMMAEEARGDAAANQARRELIENGHDMSSSQAQNQPAYDRGYDRGVEEARRDNPDATPEDLDAAGRRSGEESVRQEYESGRVRTSTPGNPAYTDYYGGAWDRAHPTSAGGGTP
ncbi:MAG TPA: DUF6782 family putative metallopeptidase, partial [Bryobacteraceae bacterium]|nr:DUF6782 family putative metallopeptidase [Bryobacteraceae bacterium]